MFTCLFFVFKGTIMKFLEDAILKYGKVYPGEILNVSSFLNNLIDINILDEMANSFYEHFKDEGINKILTVEASGIAIATLLASKFRANILFAKKKKTLNISDELYSASCFSFTHKTQNTIVVPKEYLKESDNVLIVDDFLATGEALNALLSLCESAKANVKGVGICIEKGFNGAGDKLRKSGINLLSLAVIDKMDDDTIIFRKN